MALQTGLPNASVALGTMVASDEIYIEGAPNLYFQQWDCVNMTPDADGYYWGLSGTASCKVFQLGCYENVRLGDNLVVNSVRCDTVGDKSAIQKRNYLEIDFTIKSILPLSMLSHLIKGGAAVTSGKIEKLGIGQINNNRYYRVYLPKVYDSDAGDYVSFTLHKCQFVEAFQLNFAYGAPWTFGARVRAYANDTLPDAQLFATVIRADPSAL